MLASTAIRTAIVLVACVVMPGTAAAQSAPPLLDAYGRTIAILNFTTSYVGESLLACAERSFLDENQAQARFTAYRVRNAELLERAAAWREEAAKRLRSQGQESAAQERADEAASSAITLALMRVQEESATVRDLRAMCAGKVEGIEAGRYDLSLNAEFVSLLKGKP